MDAVKGMANINIAVLKEPRGLLRIIQFVLAILSFAVIVNSGSFSTIVTVCVDNSSATKTHHLIQNLDYSYPFRVQDTAKVTFCQPPKPVTPAPDYNGFADQGWASSAEFFVFVGVMAFLIVLALFVLYIGFADMYANNPLVAKVDFILSAVWAVLWFIASCAWAAGLNNLHYYMSTAQVQKRLVLTGECVPDEASANQIGCMQGHDGDKSAMIAACLFGFLNMGVWAGGLWFIFKETSWHKDRQSPPMDTQPTSGDFDTGPVDPTPYQGGDVPPQNQF